MVVALENAISGHTRAIEYLTFYRPDHQDKMEVNHTI